jgi:hypothetical protein
MSESIPHPTDVAAWECIRVASGLTTANEKAVLARIGEIREQEDNDLRLICALAIEAARIAQIAAGDGSLEDFLSEMGRMLPHREILP